MVVATNALKGSGILLMLIILCSAPALAASFSVKVTPVKDRIFLNGVAQYTLEITNRDAVERSYLISSPETIGWDIYTKPRSAYLVTVGPNTFKEVDIYVRSQKEQSGHFNLRVTVTNQKTGASLSNIFTVDVLPELGEGPQYEPAVSMELIADDEFDPRQRAVIKVRIKNLVPRKLKNVAININSDLFQDSAVITLEPMQDRTQVFFADIDRLQEPRQDILRAEAVLGESGRTYRWHSENKVYSIKAYADIERTESTRRTFLRSATTYDFVNNGNVPETVNFQYPMPLVKDLFSSVSVRSSVQRINGERYRAVAFELSPEETAQLTVASNYRSLFYLALLTAAYLVLYMIFRAPIIIRKGAISLDRKHDGMSEVKISIYLKNRTQHDFEKLTVIDRIPHLTEMAKDFSIGTIQPAHISTLDKKHSMVKYNIAHLESFEERIITYKIKSRLTMIGGLTLPSAVLKYRTRRKRVRSTYSNRVILS